MYFFAHDHQDLYNYSQSNPEFIVYLHSESRKTNERKVIGSMVLPFKDYFSSKNIKKDFYKMFNVTGVPFGWGL